MLHMLEPNPQSDGIGRWHFWDMIRSWGLLMELINNGISAHKRGPTELPVPFHHVRTQWGDSHPWTRKWAFARHHTCWHLDLGRRPSRTVRYNCLLSICHPVCSIFVTAAGIDQDRKSASRARAEFLALPPHMLTLGSVGLIFWPMRWRVGLVNLGSWVSGCRKTNAPACLSASS